MTKTVARRSSKTDSSRRFPIRCIQCAVVAVGPAVVPYQIDKNQDGKLYALRIPKLRVNRCGNCGKIYLGADADSQINAALRDKLGLLTPDQIRGNLDELRLNQKDAAERMGVAPETMSRWLTGAMIQSRAMDNLLRAFFGCSEVRDGLSGKTHDRTFGICVAPGGK